MPITPYNTDSFAYLEKKILQYYEMRGLKMPDLKDATLWLATEVGELLDAIMRLESGWVRNNPHSLERTHVAKLTAVEDELGDCLMMLTVAALLIDADLINILLRKMNKKTGGELLAGQKPLDPTEYQPIRNPNFNILGDK